MSVRKTQGPSAPRGVVHDFTAARSRLRGKPSPEVDSAGVSESARDLARAREAVAASPELRAARVAALKQQIARGEYNPDPREVARKLLERGF